MNNSNKPLEIIINFDFAPYTEGQTLKIPAAGGIPTEKYWRDRLRDAEHDGCVTVKKPRKTNKIKPDQGEL